MTRTKTRDADAAVASAVVVDDADAVDGVNELIRAVADDAIADSAGDFWGC